MIYLLSNKTNQRTYKKDFKTDVDARHYIINNFDLSLEWEYKQIETATKFYPLTMVLNHGGNTGSTSTPAKTRKEYLALIKQGYKIDNS